MLLETVTKVPLVMRNGDDDRRPCHSSHIKVRSAYYNLQDQKFESYREDVVKLALDVLYPGQNEADIRTEFIADGSFNRVIAITSQHDSDDPSQSSKCRLVYVLRVPLDFERATYMSYEAGILKYVAKHLNYPVPGVVCFDSTSLNALGMPYMIQTYVDGIQLGTLWDELNREQRKSATRALTQLLLDMRQVKSDRIGAIGEAQSLQCSAVIEQFPLNAGRTNTSRPEPAKPQTTLQWFREMCQRRKQTQTEVEDSDLASEPLLVLDPEGNQYMPEIEIWDGLARSIEALHEKGYLPDTAEFCLFHGDLHGGNILGKIVNETTVQITGVIDWDFAAFGPDTLLYSSAAGMIRGMEEEGECSTILQEMMGPAYKKLSYGESFLVSRLFSILRKGIHEPGVLACAKECMKDFESKGRFHSCDLLSMPYVYDSEEGVFIN
ncbi:hypothetical protein K491DRAFT_761978 [Lophiostoma macrostomum CBS 122681]|uniref:Aminoglycoside phosphotransferase domain-containing protein n=1 Tax=Lophiostoma macrostomum CBS 122681 TaxID=1314788 RepID=A0A6A6SV24_9PLEO|nr:hypothetical protein K491DRAFT_761978 [Lophiostoma macrostomum CBS 122681]